MARWLTLTLSRSLSKVHVIGQISWSQEENVAKMVGATSNGGFLVFWNSCLELTHMSLFWGDGIITDPSSSQFERC